MKYPASGSLASLRLAHRGLHQSQQPSRDLRRRAPFPIENSDLAPIVGPTTAVPALAGLGYLPEFCLPRHLLLV